MSTMIIKIIKVIKLYQISQTITKKKIEEIKKREKYGK